MFMMFMHDLRLAASRRTVLIALTVWPWRVQAQIIVPPEILSELPDARLQGQGIFNYLDVATYQARLWTSADYWNTRFALELKCQRTLRSHEIAEHIILEMKKTDATAKTPAKSFLKKLVQMFPDIQKNDRLTAIRSADRAYVCFFLNGILLDTIGGNQFASRFFQIWLDETTSVPSLRKQL
jgi:hypothetical protein